MFLIRSAQNDAAQLALSASGPQLHRCAGSK